MPSLPPYCLHTLQHHNTHYHPFVDPETPGNKLVITAPEPEDFDASLTSYLEILLTATDAQGLSMTTSLKIYPRNVEVTIDSVPSGLEVVAYGDVHVTPKKVITWENHIFEVQAYDQTVDGDTYNFAAWSDGGEQTHEFEALPISGDDGSVIREDGNAKNVIVATFLKNGAPVKDDEMVDHPAEETGVSIEEELEEAIEDEGELVAIEQDESAEESFLPVPDGEPSSTATAITVDLFDFSIAIKLSGSAVRRRQLRDADVVSYLNENLTSFTADALRKEIRNIVRGSGLPYAKPNDIRLTRKGIIVKEGESYEAVFGGQITFKRKKDNQHLPPTVAVQSMQIQAIDELGHQIFYDLKTNVPEARVSTVITSTDVPDRLYANDSPNTSSEGDITNETMDTNFIIVLSCAIAGGLALVAMAAVLIVRSRRTSSTGSKNKGAAADDNLDFPKESVYKEAEESSLIANTEEPKDTVEMNSTMDTDNGSPPNTPTKEMPEAAPITDDSDSVGSDDVSIAGSSLAVAFNPTGPAGQDLAPEAASDDEGSTHFGS